MSKPKIAKKPACLPAPPEDRLAGLGGVNKETPAGAGVVRSIFFVIPVAILGFYCRTKFLCLASLLLRFYGSGYVYITCGLVAQNFLGYKRWIVYW